MPERKIDCDVHCATASHEVLLSYLSDHWRELQGITRTPQAGAIVTSYPRWLPMLATDGAELTLQSLRERVLADATLAILYCYQGVESYTHPYLGPAIATAVNRWLAEEWLDREPRLRASAAVTPQHVGAAVEEIERIAEDERFVQVLLPARSATGYGNQRFWPLLEAAARHRLPVAITYGGGTGSPPTPVNWLGSFFEEYAAATLTFQSHLMSLVMSGIFQRLPELRIVIAESGLSWLPSLMWRMDQEWRAFQREVPWVSEPPSAYVRRHFRFTIAPLDGPPADDQLCALIEQIGSDEVLMYASDHPHRYPPNSLLELLSAEQRTRVLYDNAAAIYRGLPSELAFQQRSTATRAADAAPPEHVPSDLTGRQRSTAASGDAQVRP